MKTISEMKKCMNGINSRLNITEEKVSELAGIVIENI